MTDNQPQTEASPAPSGSPLRFGQLVVQTFAGDMVLGADGLAGKMHGLVDDVLSSAEDLSSADTISGLLLARLASDPQFSASLQVSTKITPLVTTVWLRHHQAGVWWVATGSDPDILDWVTWSPHR